MKCLMFGWELPPFNSGGLGMACRGLGRALHEEGIEVLFVLPRRVPTDERWARFFFVDETMPRDPRHLANYPGGYARPAEASARGDELSLPHVSGWSLLAEVERYAAFARVLAAQEEYDVIHAHDWLTYQAGIAAKAISGKPLIAHVHATEFDRTGFGNVNQTVYDIERAGMHAADQVLAVSEYTRGIVIDRYGVPAEKVAVVHNGIDADDGAVTYDALDRVHALKDAGRKIVLFVGRITLQKGPDYFVEAARRVLAERDDVIFVVSGEGDMHHAILERAAYHGIGDRFLFVGFLRGRELARMYAQADLVVMPSVSEPFGIVPLEALLNGTPVLISKQSGVGEVLPNALKADFWDVEAMADQILGVMAYPALGQTLREGGRRDVEKLWWKHAAEKVGRMYTTVIELFKRML